MTEQDLLDQIRAVKARYESALLRKANVVGVAIGLRTHEGIPYGEPGLIVHVTHKVPLDELRPRDRIPKTLDGVKVWVEAVGPIRAERAAR